jgi:hypothetical protein
VAPRQDYPSQPILINTNNNFTIKPSTAKTTTITKNTTPSCRYTVATAKFPLPSEGTTAIQISTQHLLNQVTAVMSNSNNGLETIRSQVINAIPKISRHFNEPMIHALANITNTQIDFTKINTNKRNQLLKLSYQAYNRASLRLVCTSIAQNY